jgi:hypothetical protein
VGGPERLSRLQMGLRVARYLRLDSGRVTGMKRLDAEFPEVRPRDCSLDATRWRTLFPGHAWPDLEAAMKAMYE